MISGNYPTRASLITGISQFVKPPKCKELIGRETASHLSTERRCYQCNELGHKQVDCPKRRKVVPDQKALTCNYCKKRGHLEADWNVDSLMDSGSDCSLLKEQVARRAGCKIEPYATYPRVIGQAFVRTICRTTALLQTGDVSLELDFYVMENDDMHYDVIVGKNAVALKDIRMVTDCDSTRLERVLGSSSECQQDAPECNGIISGVQEAQEPLEMLLDKYKGMITKTNFVGNVTTAEMHIVTKSEK
ncbi:hypothetical protein KPH14_012173, partial [Odynerus spinipes]